MARRISALKVSASNLPLSMMLETLSFSFSRSPAQWLAGGRIHECRELMSGGCAASSGRDSVRLSRCHRVICREPSSRRKGGNRDDIARGTRSR
jgi:hypothetical protein